MHSDRCIQECKRGFVMIFFRELAQSGIHASTELLHRMSSIRPDCVQTSEPAGTIAIAALHPDGAKAAAADARREKFDPRGPAGAWCKLAAVAVRCSPPQLFTPQALLCHACCELPRCWQEGRPASRWHAALCGTCWVRPRSIRHSSASCTWPGKHRWRSHAAVSKQPGDAARRPGVRVAG